jgi:hypothetical protein
VFVLVCNSGGREVGGEVWELSAGWTIEISRWFLCGGSSYFLRCKVESHRARCAHVGLPTLKSLSVSL